MFMRFLVLGARILTAPLRFIAWLLLSPFRLLGRIGSRVGGGARGAAGIGRRVGQAARGGAAAESWAAGRLAELDSTLAGSGSAPQPALGKIGAGDSAALRPALQPARDDEQRTIFFLAVPVLELHQPMGGQLTLEEARNELQHGERFFRSPFPLFSSEGFFYEEVEAGFLEDALDVEHAGIDRYFFQNLEKFRRITQTNTRRLLINYPLFVINLALALGAAALFMGPMGSVPELAAEAIVLSVIFVAVTAIMVLLYRVSYKAQQRFNTQRLSAYIAQKLDRMHQNLLRVKERIQTVHLDKTIHHEASLRDELTVWSGTYQWLTIRMLFCEFLIRNMMFRTRRDTFLFHFSGQLICILVASGFLGIMIALSSAALPDSRPWPEAAMLGGLILAVVGVLYWLILRAPVRVVEALLEANQWSRFHAVDIMGMARDATFIDKWEIVRSRSQHVFGGGARPV